MCLLVGATYWRPPLLLSLVSLFWDLVNFLLWMWLPLHWEIDFSGLRVHLWGFFLWLVWSSFSIFQLKVYFIGYSNAASSLFPGTTFLEKFPAFCSEQCLLLSVRYISCMQQNSESCSNIQSVSLCLFFCVCGIESIDVERY